MDFPRHWHEECGVVGIAAVAGAAELASLALHALQHRGQESAGVTVADGHRLKTHKHLSLQLAAGGRRLLC